MSKLKVDELQESTTDSNITVASGTNLVVTDSLTVGGAAPYLAGGTDIPIADGGTGASSASAAFTALKQSASESATGVVELATTSEVTAGTDTERAVTPAGVQAAVDALVDSAPGALDTLNELAAALGDDASYASTVTTALALKAPIASPTFTGTIAIPNIANLETAVAANTAKNTNVSTDLGVSASGSAFTVTSSDGNNASLTLADTDNWGVMSDEMFDKLDGIETSADVTDATNVTAAGALMDSECAGLAALKATTGTFLSADESKLDGIEASADVTDATNVTAAGALMDSEVTNLAFVKALAKGISDGNVLTANDAVADNDYLQINGTEVEGRTYAEVRSDLGISDDEIIDWTADQGSTNIHSGNYTNTTYSVQDGELSQNNFTNTDHSKLDGIEASADVTDATNVTAAGALMDSEVTNLAEVKAFDTSDYATAAQGSTADAALPKAGGAMTGAITTNSTFDGVDIATRDAILTSTTTTANAALPKAGGTMSGAIAMGTSKITGMGNPTAAQDSATKAYVDSVAQGLDVKSSCAVATTANITLSGEQTIDGVVTSTSRVLVKDQSDASENGVYVTASGSWARATDFDAPAEVASSFIFISGGTVGADTGWVCTNEPESVTVDTDNITFSQFSDAGHITAGTGLTKSGNSINIADDGVTYAKMQNVSADESILGRVSGADGVVEELTKANVLTMLNVADGANAYTHPTSAGNKHIPSGGSSGQFLKYSSAGTATWASDNDTVYTHPNHSGDVTSSADGAQTIADDAVTYAKMQNVSADERILGRVSGANGVIEELTKANVLTMLNVEDGADVTDATNVDAAGAIMASDVDVKGDIFAGTADNTVSRLAAGTNDYVLTADSAEATGLKWAEAAGGIDGITSTANATAITIDSSENVKFHKRVGIGVTPETWDSNANALQFGSGGGLWFFEQPTYPYILHLSENVYCDDSWNGVGFDEYIANGKASDYQQKEGTHTFKVAGSGIADNAISWTTAMTIDNSGDTKFSGDVLPSVTNGSCDLGSATYYWGNIYTGDLNLSNARGDGNEVDGTSGSWTIQEGDENLFLINRETGKKFKFKLEEIE